MHVPITHRFHQPQSAPCCNFQHTESTVPKLSIRRFSVCENAYKLSHLRAGIRDHTLLEIKQGWEPHLVEARIQETTIAIRRFFNKAPSSLMRNRRSFQGTNNRKNMAVPSCKALWLIKV